MTENTVRTTTYGYDSYGRPTSLAKAYTGGPTETTTWAYDASTKRMNKQTFSAGRYEDYGYDAIGRLNEISVKTSANAWLDYQKK